MIAHYFGVNTRTVQLWEQDRGLPIHRYPGPRGRVYALKSELDAWGTAKPPEALESATTPRPRRHRLWAASLVFSAALIIWFAAPLRRESPLSSCRVDGQILIAFDATGREAWRYGLGHPLPQLALKSLGEDAQPWFGDLNGDGEIEMLCATPHFSQSSQPDRLLCFSRAGCQVAGGHEPITSTFRVMHFLAV